MFQPTAFMDGNFIRVDNKGVPRYRYTGVTYKDKLKNGLSLDYVFNQQDVTIHINTLKTEQNVIKESGEKKYKEVDDSYEHLEKRNVKKVFPKKNKNKNKYNKPNNVRMNGFRYKCFIIEDNLPELFNESHEKFYQFEFNDVTPTTFSTYFVPYYSFKHKRRIDNLELEKELDKFA